MSVKVDSYIKDWAVFIRLRTLDKEQSVEDLFICFAVYNFVKVYDYDQLIISKMIDKLNYFMSKKKEVL